MKVKIKKLHPDAKIPKYSNTGDAGLDLTAVSYHYDENGNHVYGTGLSFEIPEGHVMLLFPRSSISKTDLMLCNAVGVVDAGFRGEVTLKFSEVGRQGQFWNVDNEYEVGDRVAQAIILPYPQIEFEEVEDLSETERGSGSYGSTGR